MMAIMDTGDVQLSYAAQGAGPPLVLVHGSWGSGAEWASVMPALAERFRVIAYDRRGHGASTCPPGQGSVREDAADLAALIDGLGLGPAWVVGNSFGGSIALRMAGARPELVRGVSAHEPPLFGLLAGDTELAPALAEVGARIETVVRMIAAGDPAGGAERFMETVALGPGSWVRMPVEARELMIAAAPTFLDETRDPEQLSLDVPALAAFSGSVLLTQGTAGPPGFAAVIRRLAASVPGAEVVTMEGAGHIPHMTHPPRYAALLGQFAGRD